jgi:hypothetical protein
MKFMAHDNSWSAASKYSRAFLRHRCRVLILVLAVGGFAEGSDSPLWGRTRLAPLGKAAGDILDPSSRVSLG